MRKRKIKKKKILFVKFFFGVFLEQKKRGVHVKIPKLIYVRANILYTLIDKEHVYKKNNSAKTHVNVNVVNGKCDMRQLTKKVEKVSVRTFKD